VFDCDLTIRPLALDCLFTSISGIQRALTSQARAVDGNCQNALPFFVSKWRREINAIVIDLDVSPKSEEQSQQLWIARENFFESQGSSNSK
jgi:hypothetical protein